MTAFASAASTAAQWDRVRQVRAGEIDFDGLEIDTDLSWQLLVSLAAGGVIGEAEIDEALAADNTAKGGEFAAQAKAALPTAAAKQAAWSSLIDSDDLPNTLVRSTAVGFVHPASVELLNDFVQPYFDMLLPIWESRSYQIAQYLIVGLFPAPLASISPARCDAGVARRATAMPRRLFAVSSARTSPVSSVRCPCRSATRSDLCRMPRP